MYVDEQKFEREHDSRRHSKQSGEDRRIENLVSFNFQPFPLYSIIADVFFSSRDLAFNTLNGSIPENLGRLTRLKIL